MMELLDCIPLRRIQLAIKIAVDNDDVACSL